VCQGHLEALRGEADSNQVIPTMGFVEHESSSEQVGVSRTNRAEAKFICQWIRSNTHLIAAGGSLENAVAVIITFAIQAKVIKSELSRIGLDNIKVGTVHTFQGAECDLVLFSSVYGANDSAGSKVYDRGNNMMNVAVSRAKNSFVVFGDRNVFGCGSDSSPSGLLRQYLSAIETNQAQQETAELVYD
jgi:superfamily I DNA and/or RNA helicase